MFFYIAKVLWFVLQPSVIVLIVLAGALFARAKSRDVTSARLLFIAIGILVAAMSPIPNALTLPLEQRFARTSLSGEPIAGIIILGGSEEPVIAANRSVHALNDAGERFTEAVALSRRLPQAKIVFSGGSGALLPQVGSEAETARAILIDLGVAPERIIVESQSRDTWENANFTKAIVKPQPGERWLLVTSAWHMPRSMGIFRAADFPIEPWPVDYRTAGWSDVLRFPQSPAEGLRRLELVMREYVGLAVYAVTGRSNSLFPGPV